MKNLHIDLILPTEQRSASPVSFKLIVRVFVIVVVVLVAMGVGTLVAGVQTVKGELARIKQDISRAEPREKKAVASMKKLGEFVAMQEEVKTWARGRVAWHDRLTSIRDIVPETIQLNLLAVADKMVSDKNGAAWVGDIEIRGRGEGAEPKKDVDDFVDGFKTITNFVAGAKVMDFKADPAKNKHRLFGTVVTLKPQYVVEQNETRRKK